jgi:ketopantoate reductase
MRIYIIGAGAMSSLFGGGFVHAQRHDARVC